MSLYSFVLRYFLCSKATLSNIHMCFYPFNFQISMPLLNFSGFPGDSDSKKSTYLEDLASIPGLGRSPGEGHGNLYSCLENSVDRGTWWATVHGITMNQTQLSNCTTTWCSFTFIPWEEQSYSCCLLMLGWRSGMLGLGCLLLHAAVFLIHSSGPKLVHLLLAYYKRSL